jgi:hypothetical protein
LEVDGGMLGGGGRQKQARGAPGSVLLDSWPVRPVPGSNLDEQLRSHEAAEGEVGETAGALVHERQQRLPARLPL